jgi:hypothetical protein
MSPRQQWQLRVLTSTLGLLWLLRTGHQRGWLS